MTSFVDVTGGMNPLQSAQALNAAQQGTRDEIDWANVQALKNIMSKHINDDNSLDQVGFVHEAAKAGIGPAAIKEWLDNQNAVNAAALKQTQTNNILKLFNLNPESLRDQSKLPGTAGAGGLTEIDGIKLQPGQSINYNNEQGSGAPTGPSTLNIDDSPNTSDEVRARAAARATGADAFAPTSNTDLTVPTTSSSASTFAPKTKPVTGAKAMTSENEIKPGENEVVVNGRNEEADEGDTFTTPAPEDNSQTYTATPDRRSILERLADSGSGQPTTPNTNSSSDNSNIFDYSKVVKTGNLNLKAGIDATLAKLGKTPGQVGVNEILDLAAKGVPVPMPQMKDGEVDSLGYTQAVQDYYAKVNAAKTAAAQALASGNDTALAEILTQKKYTNIEQPQAKRQAKVFSQEQNTVAQLQAKGYKGVNPSNAAEYQKVDTDLENAKSIISGIHDLTSDIRKDPKMDKDELGTRTSTFLLRTLSLEGAGTEGAADLVMASLGIPQSTRQQFAQLKTAGVSELPGNFVAIVKSAITKNKPKQFAKLLDDIAKGIITNGAAGAAAKAHGLSNPFNIPATGAGAFAPKPAKSSKSSNTPKIGSKNSQGQIWTGKRWM